MPGASFAGNRIIFSALSVASVIRFAYNLRVYQVSGGPSWINEDSYDIVAKAEGSSPLTVDQFRQLVQAVLANRFRLSVRHQTKEEPVYALVVGTKGFRLKESSSDQFSMKAGKTLIEVSAGTMAQLSATLSANVDRPVVNRTGLTGKYDFKLEFSPENVVANTADPNGFPSIFVAVQEQLGLRLEPAKEPVEILVIDHVERPSGN
jgi:uncharacterized protein (TIGR03435 family)